MYNSSVLNSYSLHQTGIPFLADLAGLFSKFPDKLLVKRKLPVPGVSSETSLNVV